MSLGKLRFGTMALSWSEAERIGMAWFPTLSGGAEGRMTTSLGRELLAAVALHVRTTAVVGAADMEHVSHLIAKEIEHRGKLINVLVVAGMPEIEQVARRCLPTQSSLWSDPALFLRLNLVDWRVPEVLRRWPSDWLR